MNAEYPEPEWLVQDLIPGRGITILSGDPSSYKTWIMLDLIKSVATESKLFGYFECSKKNVLLIDEENHETILNDRFKQLGVDSSTPNIYILPKEGFHTDNDDHMKIILDFIKEKNIGLVCIDSLVRIHTKDENVASQMSSIFNSLNKFNKLGAKVVITHHHNKQKVDSNYSSGNLRGSSDILAAIDCHIAVKANKESKIISLSQKKMRISKELEPFNVDITTDGKEKISFVYNGMAVENKTKMSEAQTKILDLLRAKSMYREEINKALEQEISKSAIQNALQELEENKEIYTKVEKHGKKKYYLPTEHTDDEENNLEHELSDLPLELD